MKRKYKLGKGWTHVAGSVWDHTSGVRLHLLGMLRLPDGRMLDANQWPEIASADECIRISGGKRRRGLMLWAISKTESN